MTEQPKRSNLVVSRHSGEAIIISGDIVVTVVEVRGKHVKLGVVAPPEMPVNRLEKHGEN